MTIKSIESKEIWEEFSLSTSPNNFLQSWNWGEFNQDLDKKYWRLGIYENEILVGICLVIKIVTKLGNYLYVPRGPIVTSFSSELLQDLVNNLKQIAKEEVNIGF